MKLLTNLEKKICLFKCQITAQISTIAESACSEYGEVLSVAKNMSLDDYFWLTGLVVPE